MIRILNQMIRILNQMIHILNQIIHIWNQMITYFEPDDTYFEPDDTHFEPDDTYFEPDDTHFQTNNLNLEVCTVWFKINVNRRLAHRGAAGESSATSCAKNQSLWYQDLSQVTSKQHHWCIIPQAVNTA